MEVEAKYGIPDRETYERLLAIRSLGGFVAESFLHKQVEDRYFDTAERAFLRGGFACRARMSAGRPLITLKSLTPAHNALHQRIELEVRLESGNAQQIAEWPASPARTLAAELSQGQPLTLLLQLWQERHQRILHASDGREVIELSLDCVRLIAQTHAVFYELEAELLPAGAMNELQAVDDVLRQEWELAAEPCSKFERALSFADRALLSYLHDRSAT